VVILFGSALYGVYSIGAVALTLAGIIRTTVTSVIFPQMSEAQSKDDLAKVLNFNSSSNVACALFIFPVLAFIFAAASPLIRLIYTDGYAGAIPVLRLNVVAFVVAAVEISTVMLVLRQGSFLLLASLISLPVGLAASYAASQAWGMAGAAAGLVVGNFVAIFVLYAHASRLLALPVRALQDWRTIARIGGAAILAGVAAYVALLAIPAGLGHLAAILISGVAFCCAYLPCLIVLGQWGLVADLLALPPGLRSHIARRFWSIVR
jgi:teichuronic acid exporter